MHKRLVVSFVLTILTLVYLAYCLIFTPPVNISDIDNMPTNTHIILKGTPQNINYNAKEATFYLESVQIRAAAVKSILNKTLFVEGYVARYQDRTWVQALQIKYDS